MPSDPPPAPKVVGFPLYPGATLLDFAGATQVFAFGGMTPIWLAPTTASVLTTEGVSVIPTHTFAYRPKLDVLFVPGGGAEGVVAAMFDETFQGFLKAAAAEAAWAGSVCTGAFIVAAAGLLRGCRTTTYWSQIPNLERLGSRLGFTVEPDYPRYVLEPSKGRFTGGGVSSSIDLALALVSALGGGDDAARYAQLAIQYKPDPPVCAGDPSQAPPALTDKLRGDQGDTFIKPIGAAVDRIVGGSAAQ